MKSFKVIFRIFLPVMLAMVSEPALPQSKTKISSVSVSRNDNQVHRWSSSNGVSKFNMEVRGKIEVSDDDRDIKAMSDDGYLEISKTVFGSKRTIVIESAGNGKLQREYYEGRTKMSWEPGGRKWMEEILPEIVRNTTLGAASRVDRFFKRGGVPAVLEEIKQMSGDHAKSHYADLLMKKHPVQPKDYAMTISTLSDVIDSDHYITNFLTSYVSRFMKEKDATTAVFQATRKIESDHYKTVLIKEALKGQTASLENVRIILKAASEMESDHYITEVLTSLLKQNNLSDAVITEMISTSNAIESDHYKTVVLTTALAKSNLSGSAHHRVVEAVKSIESDHYITVVINRLLDNKLTDESLSQLMDIMSSVESDHYRSEILRTLLSKQDLPQDQFNKLMESVADMKSDHYITTVLQKAVSNEKISDSRLIRILNVTKEMNSDHYITVVLLDVAPLVNDRSNTVKEAYRAAAKNISSDHYYGKALKAID